MKSFGELYKQFRLKKKFGVREVCRLNGWSSGNLVKMEKSKLWPPSTKAKIDKLCAPLDLTESQKKQLYRAALNFHTHRILTAFNTDLQRTT